MKYSYLLDKAAGYNFNEQTKIIQQIDWLIYRPLSFRPPIIYVLGGNKFNNRICKPIYTVIGETYEYINSESNMLLICEKV